MKDLFIVLAVTISTSTFAFADSGFGISKKNNEISNEIKSRITDGLHFGVNKLGEECNVAIDGTFIKIKTPNFIKDNDRLYDCLQDDDIACFEFSNGIYPARKTWLNNGNIFKAKIIKKTDSFFHLKAKRILGGSNGYELVISKENGQTSISIFEAYDSEKRKLECTVDMQ